jgi:hypothetical protein
MVAPGVQPIGFGMGTKVGLGTIATASFFWVAREFIAELNEEPLRLATARTRTNLRITVLLTILIFLPLRIMKLKTAQALTFGSMTFLPDAFKS